MTETLLEREPAPCNLAWTTAIHPLIWCFESRSSQGSFSSEECFVQRHRHHRKSIQHIYIWTYNVPHWNRQIIVSMQWSSRAASEHLAGVGYVTSCKWEVRHLKGRVSCPRVMTNPRFETHAACAKLKNLASSFSEKSQKLAERPERKARAGTFAGATQAYYFVIRVRFSSKMRSPRISLHLGLWAAWILPRFADGIGTPNPDPINLVNWHL